MRHPLWIASLRSRWWRPGGGRPCEQGRMNSYFIRPATMPLSTISTPFEIFDQIGSKRHFDPLRSFAANLYSLGEW